MRNEPDFAMGTPNTLTALNQELSNSTLTQPERMAFTASLEYAHKSGSYTCLGSPNEEHRSSGAYVRIPFRTQCDTELREYFIGTWVNDCPTAPDAEYAVGIGLRNPVQDGDSGSHLHLGIRQLHALCHLFAPPTPTRPECWPKLAQAAAPIST